MIIFNFTSSTINAHLISNVGKKITNRYAFPSTSFHDELMESAEKYGMTITFFTATFDDEQEVIQTYVLYSVSPFSREVQGYGKPIDWNEQQYEVFFEEHIFNGESEFTYVVSSPSTLVYGGFIIEKEYNNTVFFYMETYRVSSNFNFVTIIIQLVCASIFCVLIATLLSLLYSRQFSEPIIEYARAAELLAKGKYGKITFKHRGIREIDSLSASLLRAAEQIKQTDDFRREFLANITHDLRTPITMMRGYAEMIRDISGDNKEKRTSHAQIIIDESERLTLLVEDILLMSKLETGTLVLNKTIFDVSMLATTVIQRFKIRALKEGYIFNEEIEGELLVNADMQKIEQVLYNLIANAVNYSGQKKEITVKAFMQKNEKCRVEISDKGKGILPEDIDLIWDRYYRVNQNTRKVIGSGIGLNIVKGILLAHEAQYGVISEIGKGTTFWFEL